nr:T-cell surface antigen CD2 isoform X1 [Zonotrichia albicollis]XP_026651619.1 T-cell surface antigen CD2 isoform X1 [Zonotrichia albicollis]XP_026651620.1 T-cell surface antigen CD2 isoform X1 [Zonotrichia albicollis]
MGAETPGPEPAGPAFPVTLSSPETTRVEVGSSTSWVYKAVNETALLSIAAPGSIYEATWRKGTQRLVQIRDNRAKHFVNKEQCRCAILRNGTLEIQRLEKEDSGNYTVQVYQKNGQLKAEESIMLLVQEPVPQPILMAECRNKSVSIKCEAKGKAKDEVFLIELTQPNGKNIQKNATVLEWRGWNSGTFRCVVKNKVSEKMAEKAINCSELEPIREQSKFSTMRNSNFLLSAGKMDFYLILSIAGGAVFFVIFVICIIYCIRRRKTKRNEIHGEERAMQTLPVVDHDRGTMRELPPAPSKPTPRQQRVQQRPLPPQPQEPQQPRPQPRPRTQPRTPNPPRHRP